MRGIDWCKLLSILLLASVATTAAAKRGGAFKPVQTGLMRGGDPARAIEADVTGVRDLYLVATFGPDSYQSDQAIWGEPKLLGMDGRWVDLATLKPERSQVGFGKLYVNKNHRGKTLEVAGKTFETGFWAHGPSMLHFKLDGKYTRFAAQVGIDTGAGKNGSVQFEVTDAAPKMPAKSVYMGKDRGKTQAPSKILKASPAAQAPHRFDPETAQALLERGIDKLVFIRRFTLNANHVYTEYVNSRWMPGGGLCVLDLRTGEAKDLVPQLKDGVFNRFDIAYDASKIVFDFKKGDGEGYRIYEVGIDGAGLRQLTFPVAEEKELVRRYATKGYHHGTDDLHPCYLPTGDIVFVSTRCQTSVLCHSGDIFTTKNLYRMDANGGNIWKMSSNAVSEASPAVMHDGRIIYHRWEYNDKGAGAVKCLWSVRPDGASSSEVYGNLITDPETMIYPRPIPGTDDKVVFLGTSHWGPNNAMGTVIVLDLNKDTRTREAMRLVTRDVDARAHDGFHFLIDGEWVKDKTGKPGRLFKDPYPLSEDLFAVSHKPTGFAWNDPTAYGLYLIDGEGTEKLLYKDEEISCWHPYPVMSRPLPPTPLTPTRKDLAEKNLAQCVVSDVYEGLDGVERGTIKYIRVLEQTPRPWTAHNSWKGDKQNLAHSTVGYGILGMKAQHGVVPVEEDGSANFLVPADRNIYFQALDENYMAIQTERTYVNYMPGETRGCVGCHKRAEQTPRSRAVQTILALRRAPSTPGPQPGDASGRKLLDYERQIQPVWDKHCVECHDGTEKTKAGLDLTGAATALYCNSYENLMRQGKGKPDKSKIPLVGVQVDENSVRAYVENSPPRYFGAYSSVLAALLGSFEPNFEDYEAEVAKELSDRVKALRKKHEKIKLSKAEFIRVASWLDASCQYYGSYWGMKNSEHRDSPHFRPSVPFAEAIGTQYPAALRSLYARSEE